MSEHGFFVPLVAPMLRNRKLMLVITGAAALQLGLTSLKFAGWQCPLLRFFGVPCPGCGLTRATIFLFKGDWQRSLAFHAFAPAFVLVFALMVSAIILPHLARDKVINFTDTIERRTGITVILLLGLIIYWLARLLILQSAFVKLIQS
jgi:Protein of unknown function (DUF2752)